MAINLEQAPVHMMSADGGHSKKVKTSKIPTAPPTSEKMIVSFHTRAASCIRCRRREMEELFKYIFEGGGYKGGAMGDKHDYHPFMTQTLCHGCVCVCVHVSIRAIKARFVVYSYLPVS